jgi:hypothetical protein
MCGAAYYYDGRMDDGPIKTCKCPVGFDPKTGRPVYQIEGDPDDYWKYGNKR